MTSITYILTAQARRIGMRWACEYLPVAVTRKMCGKAQRDALLGPNCTVTHISRRVVVGGGGGIRNGDGAA